MTAVIRCDRLGKCFRVEKTGPRRAYGYRTLRDDLTRWTTAPLRWFKKRASHATSDDFWALKDVSFTVEPGEVLGIIGRNGAGKSTLLKILSRITKPTEGLAQLRGRVGSLLEVGTGFHPELSGRENIYLNAAILGMKRGEIGRKFDRIVAFAEIEAFLDTPVKRYSSGMYVRLAFAVAAHLEPEILIVDEVLAVGDLAFQRKCLGRMKEVGRSGCTVLFVSHSMPAVESLCSRVLLLDGGQVAREGDVRDLIQEYHRRVLQPASGGSRLDGQGGPQRPLPLFRSATLLDDDGLPTNFLPLGGRFHLRLELKADQPIDFPTITVGIDDTLGHRLLSVQSPLSKPVLARLDGSRWLDVVVEPFPLAPGECWIKLGLTAAGVELDEIERVLHFSVTNGDAFGEGRGIHRGMCVAPSRWSVIEGGLA